MHHSDHISVSIRKYVCAFTKFRIKRSTQTRNRYYWILSFCVAVMFVCCLCICANELYVSEMNALKISTSWIFICTHIWSHTTMMTNHFISLFLFDLLFLFIYVYIFMPALWIVHILSFLLKWATVLRYSFVPENRLKLRIELQRNKRNKRNRIRKDDIECGSRIVSQQK